MTMSKDELQRDMHPKPSECAVCTDYNNLASEFRLRIQRLLGGERPVSVEEIDALDRAERQVLEALRQHRRSIP